MLLADLQTRDHPPNLIASARLADERLQAEVLNLGGYDRQRRATFARRRRSRPAATPKFDGIPSLLACASMESG